MNLGASESFWWAQVRLFPSRLIQGAHILSRYHSPQALLVETCCLQHVHTMYKSIWPTRHARSQTHTWQWTHGYDYVCVFVCSTCTCMNATIFLLLIFWVHGTYPKQNAPQEWRNARNGMRMCLSGPAAWSSAIWSWQAIRSTIRRDTKGIHRVFMQHKGLSSEFTAYIQHLKCTGPNSFQANGWLTWSHCMYTCGNHVNSCNYIIKKYTPGLVSLLALQAWVCRPDPFSPPARWGLLDFMSVACSSSPLLSSSSPLLLVVLLVLLVQLRPAIHSVLCRTSTTTIHAQCSLPDLNHDHPRPVFPAGPQPRPSTPSVPCRTSTMTIHAQCSLPDLNHDHPRPVFPAGPQPRPSTPSVPCRTSTASIHAKCSLPDLM